MPELVVSSFNVHWGRGSRRQGFPPFDLVDACSRLGADVLVLAESLAPDGALPQHDAVAEALGYEVVAATPMARLTMSPRPKIAARGGDPADGGDATWNLAVLSRLPIRSHRVEPLPQLRLDPVSRSLVVAELDAGGAPLTVCGAHLPHLEFGAPLITPWLRRALPPANGPAVLAGDMNMWGWVIGAMTHRAWRRTVRGRTFPAHRPLVGIDHILVTPQVELLHAEVVPVGGSDHLPVRAVLRLG